MSFERKAAIIAFSFTLLMIIVHIVKLIMVVEQQVLLSTIFIVVSLIIIAALFLVVIINPKYSLLFGLAFINQGLISVADGEMAIGCLFILFSIGVGLKYNFFRNKMKLKLTLIVFLFICAFIIQIKAHPDKIFRNFQDLFLYSIFCTLLYFMFRKNLESYFYKKRQKSLKAMGLTEREAKYVFELLEGMSMKEIAFANGVEENTVRTSFHRIYLKIGVSDSRQLVLLAVKNEFIP